MLQIETDDWRVLMLRDAGKYNTSNFLADTRKNCKIVGMFKSETIHRFLYRQSLIKLNSQIHDFMLSANFSSNLVSLDLSIILLHLLFCYNFNVSYTFHCCSSNILFAGFSVAIVYYNYDFYVRINV